MSIQISSDSHQRGRRYNRLELKLSLCFAAMAVFISALLTFGLYQITVDWLRQSLKQRIRDAVAIGASQLDGDAFAALTDPAQENSPAYQKLQNELRRIRDAGQDFRFVYTVRKEADGKIIFVVDAEESPEDVSHLGDHYDDAGPALESRIGKKNDVFVEDDFYTDKWGSWLTGYAPVRGADGEQKVLLCADIAASTVLQKESKLFWSAVAAFGVTLPLSLFVGALLGRQHAKPIMALTRGAELITGGGSRSCGGSQR
jgi:two-component system sensor histidine kinase/response regulator